MGRTCVCASWLPIWGIPMFICRPRLWRHVLLPYVCTIAAIVLTAVMAIKYCDEQRELLHKFIESKFLSGLLVIWIIINEIALAGVLTFVVLSSQAPGRIMDDILRERDVSSYIMSAYGVDKLPEAGCGKSCKLTAQMTAFRILVLIITLPLLLIPGAHAFANGLVYPWSMMSGHMMLVGLTTFTDQARFVCSKWYEFLGFGFVACLIAEIPFLNLLFFGSNACGCAVLFERLLDHFPGLPPSVDDRYTIAEEDVELVNRDGVVEAVI